MEPDDEPETGRNPPWVRDELLLALDLYLSHRPKLVDKKHTDVKDLSDLLRSLPIIANRPDRDRFRNVNGVGLKVANFRRLDPDYNGKGMKAGNKLEEIVWDEFAHRPEELKAVVEAIKAGYTLLDPAALEDPEEDEFREGRVLYRLHRQRERNKTVIEEAKRKAKKSGRLCCCVCTFDFLDRYGSLGEDFIEGHHTRPLSDLTRSATTKVSDIALVCANCHRMLHRKRPWPTIESLKQIVKQHEKRL